jgi:hypothetical protein
VILNDDVVRAYEAREAKDPRVRRHPDEPRLGGGAGGPTFSIDRAEPRIARV